MRLLESCVLVLFAIGLPSPLLSEEMQIEKDLPYSELGGKETALDVYSPAEGETRPVVVWIHGGGWRQGDKGHLQQKPDVFTKKGFVLVSVNYRLHPKATYQEQGRDIATAIRWVKDHISEYGGDATKLFLMGHSAGAHLSALVACDHRYLNTQQLEPAVLSGVILLDGAGYDIPRQIQLSRLPRLKQLYTTVFSEDVSRQRDVSPITHIEKDKGIPPFLIFYVADRRDSKLQSQSLAESLRKSGITASAVAAENKNHMTINREIGSAGDQPTEQIFTFLEQRLNQPNPSNAK